MTVGYFVRAPSFIDAVTGQVVFNNHLAFTAIAWIVNALGGDTESWIRLPAIVAGAVCVIRVVVFAGRRFGVPHAALAAVLTATNPMFVEVSAQARGYSLAALAVVAATIVASRMG